MTAEPSRVQVSGPLAPYAVRLGDELIRRGYRPEGAARHVQLLAHLSRWLDVQGLTAEELTEERLAEFLEARRAEGYATAPSLRWAMTLLGWVPGLVVVPATVSLAATPVQAMVRDYRRYLIHERGLATGTVRGYVGVARSFLSHVVELEGCDLWGLSAREVRAFVVRECRQRHVGSARVMVPALRSLLRFLSGQGHTAHQLAAAVPAASGMKGGLLPQAVAPDVVRALSASCDPCTVVGRRDFVVLTVLSRLGLRSGEVAGLELGDLDWHRGELVVRGKGARRDRLPLPVDVGEAVVAYLADGRPQAECRALFLRVRAPLAGLTSSCVGGIVRRACRRAGVSPIGPHRLRHSAATAMLHGGASLAEIGQVLRHSRAATTAVYTKVDRAALRALAQPWPGDVA